jgi:hypothetical protein
MQGLYRIPACGLNQIVGFQILRRPAFPASESPSFLPHPCPAPCALPREAGSKIPVIKKRSTFQYIPNQ